MSNLMAAPPVAALTLASLPLVQQYLFCLSELLVVEIIPAPVREPAQPGRAQDLGALPAPRAENSHLRLTRTFLSASAMSPVTAALAIS